MSEEAAQAESNDLMGRLKRSVARCPRCDELNGQHGMVHVRYGNGAGGNIRCPDAPISVDVGEQIAQAIEAMAIRGPDNRLQHAGTIQAKAARIARTFTSEAP